MKIAIDCRSLRKKPAGVPNFLISVIHEAVNQHPDWIFFLFSNEEFSPEVKSRLAVHPSVQVIIRPLPILPRVAIIWYLVKMPFLVKKYKADLFFTPIPNLPLFLFGNVRRLVAVHDMVYKLFPSTMSRGNWWINFFLHNRSFQKADYLWAVSEYTRNEIEIFFPGRKSKNIFVGSSIDKSIFFQRVVSMEVKEELLTRLNLAPKFLLFVGTLEPRKNLSFLLSFFPDLATHGFELLIVGAKGWGDTDLPEFQKLTEFHKSKVKFSGFISTEELTVLYNIASVYVSTSLNEGFGLPQLEAMSCGCPVVTAHNSAMIEVVENAGKTVKGWEKADWISTILRVAENREYYSLRGIERAKAYDWSTIVKNLSNYLLTKPNR